MKMSVIKLSVPDELEVARSTGRLYHSERPLSSLLGVSLDFAYVHMDLWQMFVL